MPNQFDFDFNEVLLIEPVYEPPDIACQFSTTLIIDFRACTVTTHLSLNSLIIILLVPKIHCDNIIPLVFTKQELDYEKQDWEAFLIRVHTRQTFDIAYSDSYYF